MFTRLLTGWRRRDQSASSLREVVLGVRDVGERLAGVTDRELRTLNDDVRSEAGGAADGRSSGVEELGAALIVEAIRRVTGKSLYDVQLLGGLTIARGRIAEMRTGEGKTLTAAVPAYLQALSGRGVFVATSNSYLAERDCAVLRPAFELLGMSCGHLPEKAEPDVKRRIYDCDVVYATAHAFGFDYLRDQMTLRARQDEPLGQTFRRMLRDADGGRPTMQRGLPFVVVDEADNVLLDDAVSPLLLSEAQSGAAADAAACHAAISVARRLVAGQHYRMRTANAELSLLSEGLEAIHREDTSIPTAALERPWTSYVENALRAEAFYRRDVHYIVVDRKVQIVDEPTGRVMPDRTWRAGLHQAIEAKEGLPVSPEARALCRITRQRFFRMFDGIGGMTGTAQGSEAEFRGVYGVEVAPIPPRLVCNRKILPTRFFARASAKRQAVSSEVARIHATGQPILIGTRSIADSEELAEVLQSRGIPFQLLNGRQDAAEADIVSRAGEVGAVTIATNLAGRGTDIIPPGEALARGGLHVIASEPYESPRIDRQLLGRSARQGQPGSGQMFVSAEDALFMEQGAHLATGMRRTEGPTGECRRDFSAELSRVQADAERRAARRRRLMLEMDLCRDEVVAKLTGETG
jgi:preprotein translocase subunit SecA